jgi:hypothetical protein
MAAKRSEQESKHIAAKLGQLPPLTESQIINQIALAISHEDLH